MIYGIIWRRSLSKTFYIDLYRDCSAVTSSINIAYSALNSDISGIGRQYCFLNKKRVSPVPANEIGLRSVSGC